MNKQPFVPKSLQSDLAKMLPPVIAMTEELAAVRCQPYAVLGFHFTKEGAAAHLATISNDEVTQQMVLNALKSFLEGKGYKVQEPLKLIQP